MKEAVVEDYLRKRVKETRGKTRKVRWPGVRGAPDQLCLWPHLGSYAFVELKEDSQPWGLQDHQKRELLLMRSSGINATVLSSKDDVDRFIHQKTGELP